MRLVHDLRGGMGVSEDMMPMVLDLLDQVYDLRRTVKTIVRVLEEQPPEIRTSLLDALARR